MAFVALLYHRWSGHSKVYLKAYKIKMHNSILFTREKGLKFDFKFLVGDTRSDRYCIARQSKSCARTWSCPQWD